MHTYLHYRICLCFLAVSTVFLFASINSLAQSDDYLDREVFTIVEKQPEFPGGIQAMWDYLKQNVKYPSEAVKANVKGKSYVSFIVQKDGRLTDFQLVHGLGSGCDEEAMRVIKAMPSWKPGSQSGRLLKVKYTLPVLFGLDYPHAKGR
ncbi:energy transducer TonB [Spirosoma soli]|uniref:Energy transducer TonB n=1 Tax=Spirosoma soli TaxID=1770529 RepID=A0ABW5M0L2_9BACT